MELVILLLTGVLTLVGLAGITDSTDYGEGVQNMAEPTILENMDGARNHWMGIGRLFNNGTCTATLLDTRPATEQASTPAYILTSGHCINHTNGQILVNVPISNARAKVRFNFMYTSDERSHEYTLKAVKWRSMQGIDLAIIELETSLQELIKDGIQPLKLASKPMSYDSDVLIVGIPQYGTLQMSACTLQPASDIIEGQWVWRNNFMTRCKGIGHGVSGSPLLDRYTNEIIGVIGTGNFDGMKTPCTLNNPCLLDKGQYSAVEDNVYGNPTAFLHGCFKDGVMVENDPSSCPLYPRFTVIGEDLPAQIELTQGLDGEVVAPTWDYKFAIDTGFYRHKTVPVASDCEKPADYSVMKPSADAYINSEIGSQSGRYFLCIIGVASGGQSNDAGLMRNALSLPIELVN